MSDNENLTHNTNNETPMKRRVLFFASWMSKLAAAYRQEINIETQAMYLQSLGDLRLDRLELAFQQALKDCKFFPTIAEIRDIEADLILPDVAKERIEAAYQRRKEQVLSAPQPPPMISGALDKEQPKPRRPLKMLTDAEFNERVAYLKKQVKE